MTLDMLHRNRLNFAIIAKKLPQTNDVNKYYAKIVNRLLNDGVVSTVRVVTILAFATYLQELFTINLKNIAASPLEENIYYLLRRHGSKPESYDFWDSFYNFE